MLDSFIQCAAGGGGCGKLIVDTGGFIFSPQANMAMAVDELDAGIKDGSMTEGYAAYLRSTIIFSALIWILLFVALYWLGCKAMTTLNISDYFFAALFAIVILSILHFSYAYFVLGELGERAIPLIGWWKLFTNLPVMFSTISYSEMLPLNLTLNSTQGKQSIAEFLPSAEEQHQPSEPSSGSEPTQTEVGEPFETATEDACKSKCESLSAERWRWDGHWCACMYLI